MHLIESREVLVNFVDWNHDKVGECFTFIILNNYSRVRASQRTHKIPLNFPIYFIRKFFLFPFSSPLKFFHKLFYAISAKGCWLEAFSPFFAYTKQPSPIIVIVNGDSWILNSLKNSLSLLKIHWPKTMMMNPSFNYIVLQIDCLKKRTHIFSIIYMPCDFHPFSAHFTKYCEINFK